MNLLDSYMNMRNCIGMKVIYLYRDGREIALAMGAYREDIIIISSLYNNYYYTEVISIRVSERWPCTTHMCGCTQTHAQMHTHRERHRRMHASMDVHTIYSFIIVVDKLLFGS